MHPIESTIAQINFGRDPQTRYATALAEWKLNAFGVACDADNANAQRGVVVAEGNNYSSQLLTAFLTAGVTTKLLNLFAPLAAFTTSFSADPLKPLAVGQHRFVTGGATAQTDATNYESGDSIVTPVAITPHQKTVSFHVTQAELNSGLRLDNLISMNVASFASAVTAVPLAYLTDANFVTNSHLISSPAGFTFSDLSGLHGQLKKAPVKNLILDGEYFSRIINQPGLFQKVGATPGTGWASIGWDGIYRLTDWTGAASNVRGFACHPQAVAMITGLPLTVPISLNTLQQTKITLPDLDLTVVMSSWFNLQSRTAWMSLDIVVGAALLDETAGVLIKSA